MIRKLAALAVTAFFPGAGWTSDTVVLTTPDGSYTVSGKLLSFGGGYYRVETDHGSLTLEQGDVTCTGAACPTPDALVSHALVSGPADMIHLLMPPLLESFAKRKGLSYRRIFANDDAVTWELSDLTTGHLIVSIKGQVGSEDDVFTRLVAREVDLSFGRREAGRGVDQDVIALDALVPVVSVDNPRAMITLQQFRGLLTGGIDNWSELDGPDMPIRLHLLQGRDVTRSLARVFPGLRANGDTLHQDAKLLAAAVASDPTAIGLVPLSRIGNTVPLVISGPCGLASPATRSTVKAEDYPLTQPLFLHRNGARQPRIIRDFMDFARSNEAQPVISAAGFIDQGIGRIPFERQGDRLANAILTVGDDEERMGEIQRMVAALLQGDRLTLTFRFRDGSSELDPQSVSNVRRLSDAIWRGEFDGKELVFVGFSDGDGGADGNLRLSQRRARAVRRAVSALAGDSPVILSEDGFGEILPMACDDTAWGRQVNRRVEVWLRDPVAQPDR